MHANCCTCTSHENNEVWKSILINMYKMITWYTPSYPDPYVIGNQCSCCLNFCISRNTFPTQKLWIPLESRITLMGKDHIIGPPRKATRLGAGKGFTSLSFCINYSIILHSMYKCCRFDVWRDSFISKCSARILCPHFTNSSFWWTRRKILAQHYCTTILN